MIFICNNVNDREQIHFQKYSWSIQTEIMFLLIWFSGGELAYR